MDRERRNPFFAEPRWSIDTKTLTHENEFEINIDRLQTYKFKDSTEAKNFFTNEIRKYNILTNSLRDF